MNNPLVQVDPGLFIWTILTFLVLLGLLAIRVDVALTGGRSSRGRRGRRAEEAAALRPEPPRIDALL